LCAASARAQSLWELTPYRVQVYVAQQEAPQLTERLRQDVQAFLTGRIETVVGAPWNAEVTSAPADLALAMLRGLDAIQTDDLPKASLAADKVILVCLAVDYFGFHLQARELDCRTRAWGAMISRDVRQPPLLASAAAETMLAAFAPLAEIEKVDGKQVTLRLRASGLPMRDPQAFQVASGTIFRPVIRFNDRDGNLRADRPPQPVPWTYLLTRSANGTLAQCELFTGLRSPLSARRRGRTEQLAVAIHPPDQATRLTLHSRVNKERKLFGYEVYAYSPDSPETTLLGRTDINGQLLVPPGEHPLRMLVIKSGGEFLARLPLVPGLEPEALAGVANDDDRLAVEGYITGLQEEIVDLIARRAMLVARIRARLDEGEAKEAQQLLDELRKLRDRDDFATVLNEQRRKYYSSDPIVRSKVDKLFNDTREVMVRNLDPGLIDQVTKEVSQALETRPAAAPAAATTRAASREVARQE
jgi:hypothetical protein